MTLTLSQSSAPITIDDLTPREISVASLIAKHYPTKLVAAFLIPPVSPRRVLSIVSAIAYKIHADPSLDEAGQIAQWYREQVPIASPEYVVPAIPIRNLPQFKNAS